MSIHPPTATPKANRNMTPESIIKEFDIPTGFAEPLQSVRFGWHDNETGVSHRSLAQPTTSEVNFLERATSLARQILLHHQAKPILVDIFHRAGRTTPALILHVAEYILRTRHWNLVLDVRMEDHCFGEHWRYPNTTEEALTTIYVNYKNVQIYTASGTTQPSLQRAIGATAAQEKKRMREMRILLMMGTCLAHEMTHCIRLILRDYMLPFGIKVPKLSPARLSSPFAPRDTLEPDEGESGWYLEARLNGGVLQGCTAPRSRRDRRPRHLATPIDFLAMTVHESYHAYSEGQADADGFYRVRIEDWWVLETIAAFEAGDFDLASFPPAFIPRPLRDNEWSRVTQRYSAPQASPHRPPCVRYWPPRR